MFGMENEASIKSREGSETVGTAGVPMNPTASPFRDTVQMEWESDGDPATRFYIIRKIGEAPIDHHDGELIARDLTELSYDDTGLIPATEYYYALYSVKNGVRSPIEAVSTSVMVFSDVTDLRRVKISGAVQMTWSLPENASAVEVYRKPGAVAPSSRRTGEKILTDGELGFSDYEIPTGQCSYLIVCRYDYLGREYYSRGVKVTCKPYQLPPALKGVVSAQGDAPNEFLYSFGSLEGAMVKLYVSGEKADLPIGSYEEKEQFAQICDALRPLETRTVSAGVLRFSVPMRQMLYLYPVVMNDQLFTITEPTLLNTVTGIENLNYTQKMASVTLTGTLDEAVTNVIITTNDSGFVTSPRDALERKSCSADAFRAGGFTLTLRPGIHYITVFTEISDRGETVLSGATRLRDVIDTREKKIVYYAIEYTPSVTAPYKVKIDFKSEHELKVPPIDLIAGFPKPLSRASGSLVATTGGGELKKKFLKSGFYLTVQLKADRADSLKDKISLFFHSESEREIQLKEVQNI
jgi:hypothetical protein